MAVALLVVGLHATAVAGTMDLGIVTAPAGGSYHRLGEDLKKLVKSRGINLTVYPSNGSVDNVYAVSQQRGVQLAIVQSDVLAFVADQRGNPALARIADSLRLIFPLHDEEVHLLGRRELGNLEGLDGRRVAVGREGSGTYLTARRLLKLADVTPSALVPIEGAEALAELRAGRVDALFYVVGAPVASLRAIKPDEGLALLAITHKSVVEAYEPVELGPSVYDWQPTAVSTVSVKALLVAFDPERRECDAIGRFAQQVAAGTDWLSKNGHARWKRVNLEAPVKGWEQYDCVRKYVGKPPADGGSPAASAAERNPVVDAIKGALDKKTD
jgi:TRAP transporter TAXI family solute receptor